MSYNTHDHKHCAHKVCEFADYIVCACTCTLYVPFCVHTPLRPGVLHCPMYCSQPWTESTASNCKEHQSDCHQKYSTCTHNTHSTVTAPHNKYLKYNMVHKMPHCYNTSNDNLELHLHTYTWLYIQCAHGAQNVCGECDTEYTCNV